MKKEHEDVSPLSRKVMFQRLSSPLQAGVRFFLDPSPTPPWAVFANSFPNGSDTGFPRSAY
jgi:hypothetical protein